MAIVDFLYDFLTAWGLNMMMFAGPWILTLWGFFRLAEQIIKVQRLIKEDEKK